MEGSSSVAEAAEEFGVSRASIYLRLQKGTTAIQRGRPSLLDEDAMDAIVAWIRECTARGDCPTTTEVVAGASRVASEMHGRAVTFSKSTILRLFSEIKSRGLTIGYAISTSKARTEANNVKHVSGFYTHLEGALADHPILTAEPCRICSIDESPSVYNGEKAKAVDKCIFDAKMLEGRTPRREVMGNGSSNLTLMCGVCADGTKIDNAYFFKGKQMQLSWKAPPFPAFVTAESLDAVSFFPTPAGSVTQETFSDYLKLHLVPRLRKRALEGELLLLFDAPSVHEVTDELRAYFKENHILWIAFPSYTSTILDPLDLTVYGELKRTVRRIISNVSTVYSNPGAVLDKTLSLSIKTLAAREVDTQDRAAGFDEQLTTRTMILMTEAAFTLSVSNFTIREGFMKAGIYPLDPLSVLQRCHDWKEHKDSFTKDHERTTRAHLHQNLEDGVKEMTRIGLDATLTFAARITRMKAIAVEASLPLHALQGVDGERAAKKAKMRVKPKKDPTDFTDLETALSQRKAADKAVIKAKEDAKAAKAAKAAHKAKAKTARSTTAAAAPVSESGAAAPAPVAAPSVTGVPKARKAGDAGGAGGSAGSKSKAAPSTATKSRARRDPQKSSSSSSPGRKAGLPTGQGDGGR